ncbi:MAG: PKD-like domain-containing protein, partial [Dolichospermum sp.]
SNDPPGPCGTVNDAMILTINQPASVNAGADQSVCVSGSPISLAGSITGGTTSGTWTTNGGGSFGNIAVLTTSYTPNAADIAAGTVTLTLTSDNPPGECNPSSDQLTLTFTIPPTVDAGLDQTICAGSSVNLSGSYGASASTATWATSGTGNFTSTVASSGTVTSTYNPSPADITTGSVTLTLTTDDPPGTCGSVSDAMVVTINPAVVVNAGVDQDICVAANTTVSLAGSITGGTTAGTWSAAAGTFNDPTLVGAAIYTPAANTGSVTLTLTSDDPDGPCPAQSDQVTINLFPSPVVDAGPDFAICSGSTATMAATINTVVSSASWSTSGTGSFSSLNNLTAVYTPSQADITAGSVTLTITSNDPPGPCGTVNDAMILTINQTPIIQDFTINVCSGEPINYVPTSNSPNVVPSGVTYEWTVLNISEINGEMNSTNPLSSVSQTLINLTDEVQSLDYIVTPSSGLNCTGNYFTLTINVTPAPIIADINLSICSGDNFSLLPTTGGGNSSNDIVPLNTIYTWNVSNNDVNGESNQLTPGVTPISQSLTNLTDLPVIVNYTIIPWSAVCPGPS